MLYKLGKGAAVIDHRVPRFGIFGAALPAPPENDEWYSGVDGWGMLGNDIAGDCVDAAALHAVLEASSYAGSPLRPTDQEALAAYTGNTGYDPKKPETDQGSMVMGPGGFMEYWHNTGIECGGKLNKVEAYMTISTSSPMQWMQGIHIFGGVMLGFRCPANLFDGEGPPFLWSDSSGESAGGHEVWLCGYTSLRSGYRTYDLISWGQRYRATEDFLLKTVDEVCVVYDPVSMDARGVDAAGLNRDQLLKAMHALKVSRG